MGMRFFLWLTSHSSYMRLIALATMDGSVYSGMEQEEVNVSLPLIVSRRRGMSSRFDKSLFFDRISFNVVLFDDSVELVAPILN